MFRRRSFLPIVLAALFVAASCGADSIETSDEPQDESTGDESTTDDRATDGDTDRDQGSSVDTPADDADIDQTPTEDSPSDLSELRAALGADAIAIGTADGSTIVDSANSTTGPVTFDGWVALHPDHIETDDAILDYAGDQACPGLEILADFHIIDSIELIEGRAVATIEDRQLMNAIDEDFSGPIPRWSHDCATDTVTDLEPTLTVESQGDSRFETRTYPEGLTLTVESALGDSPVVLTNGDGTVLAAADDLIFGYELSADRQTIYLTSYASSAATESPEAVIAVDTTTGAERWQMEVGGFAHDLGDRVIIEALGSTLNDFGVFETEELLIVDALTGDVLDRVPFTDGYIIGLE